MKELTKETIIGVLGSGAMGSGIAQVAAASGHRVVLFDANATAMDKAKINLEKVLKSLAEKGKMSAQEADAIYSRITFAKNANEYKGCGIVIEAVIENIEVKQTVFKELEHITGPDCILATNTSSLSVVSIAAACEKPSRVVGIHFFNPAPLMPLVEIIPALTTAAEVTDTSRKLIDSWGKLTVLAKDTPGFIVNRVARPFYGEAIRIYEEGVANIATIDWAMKEIGGFKMGPFELMDFIGNDINYKVTETVWEQFFYDPRFKPSFTQKRLYEAKLFGRKSGRGHYDYSANAQNPEPVKNQELGQHIFMRILSMLINEAADALFWQVATRDDLDLAMTKGVNYPKGLLKWCDEIGANQVLAMIEALREEYHEDRYRTSPLLNLMVREKKKFY
jgi:3-hydroxybutyryl-CoA dehydrogenase